MALLILASFLGLPLQIRRTVLHQGGHLRPHGVKALWLPLGWWNSTPTNPAVTLETVGPVQCRTTYPPIHPSTHPAHTHTHTHTHSMHSRPRCRSSAPTTRRCDRQSTAGGPEPRTPCVSPPSTKAHEDRGDRCALALGIRFPVHTGHWDFTTGTPVVGSQPGRPPFSDFSNTLIVSQFQRKAEMGSFISPWYCIRNVCSKVYTL